MAIGITVIVMSTLKTMDINAGVSILAIGMTALELANFQE